MKKLLIFGLLVVASVRASCAELMPFNSNGKWGYVARDSKEMELVLPLAYEVAHPFKDGRAAVRQKGLWGFIDEKGSLVIPCIYEELGDYEFSGGAAIVKKNALFGVIDRAGKEVLPMKFLSINIVEKPGVIIAKSLTPAHPDNSLGLAGMYDLAGKPILPHEYSSIGPWFKNVTTVATKTDGKKALINNKGQALTAYEYSGVYYLDLDHFIAERGKDEGYDLYDPDGKLYFKSDYAYVGKLSSNRAIFKDRATKKQGYLNSKGEVVIPAEFVFAEDFSEDVAIVQRKFGGDKEVIDSSGKSLGTIPNADLVNDFQNGFAWLRDKTDRKYYCYNKQFQRAFPQGYHYAGDYDANGLAKVSVADREEGLLNNKGEWAAKPEYRTIQKAGETGQYIAKKEKEVHILDEAGSKVFSSDSVTIEAYDKEFFRISPATLYMPLLKGVYHCVRRKDGFVFYQVPKAP